MNYMSNILENVNRPYYFGVGGIGDFLLLMSTFYDDMNDNEFDVIFVANNIRPFTRFLNKNNNGWFKKINRFWLMPKSVISLDETLWNMLMNDDRCVGTGVTPKKFNYVKDWIECGKTSVFEYYGVRTPTKFALNKAKEDNIVVIQPIGGADDKTKIKEISYDELKKILISLFDEDSSVKVVMIGSPSEMASIEIFINNTNELKLFNIELCSDIIKAMDYCCACKKFIGTDSWGKTLAKFANKDVTVYQNKYVNASPQQMFNHHKDPGDYVFLDNWNFNIVTEK